MKTQRRNIVVFVTDQQRHDEIGRLDARFVTPTLDHLLAEGLRFESAYSSSTLCAPARGSLITGQYPHRYPGSVPYLRPSRSLREGSWTAPRALQLSGYRTAMIGKGHFRPMRADHGFDITRLAEPLRLYDDQVDDYVAWLAHNGRADWRATKLFGADDVDAHQQFRQALGAVPFEHEEKYHSTSWICEETLAVLTDHDPSIPFLLVVSFPRPHAPFDPPQAWIDAIVSDGFDVSESVDDAARSLPHHARELSTGAHGYGVSRADRYDPEVVRRVLRYRAALIAQIDHAMGRIIDCVDLSTTAICFTSDHGDYAGRRGLLMKNPFIPFDDLARVPFVWAGAGVEGGRVVTEPVQSFDLAQTLLEIAGLPVLGLDGRSLVPILEGGPADPQRIVFTDSMYQYRMLRRETVKFFRHDRSGEEMAFDLAHDPNERVDISRDGAYGEVVAELRDVLALMMLKGQIDLPHE